MNGNNNGFHFIDSKAQSITEDNVFYKLKLDLHEQNTFYTQWSNFEFFSHSNPCFNSCLPKGVWFGGGWTGGDEQHKQLT